MQKLLASITMTGALLAAAASPASADGGTLTAKDVRRVMSAHQGDVRGCYVKYGMKQRKATGKVLVNLIVERDGKVRKAEAVAEGVRGKRFERCVAKQTQKWRFPPIRHATDVQLPFLFQHTAARGAGPRR